MSAITINYKLHGQWNQVTLFSKGFAASFISSLYHKGATDIGLDQPKGADISELREVVEKLSMTETLELIEEFKKFIAKLA